MPLISDVAVALPLLVQMLLPFASYLASQPTGGSPQTQEKAMNNNTTARIVAAIASVLITTVLLKSVIIGMTTTALGGVSTACVPSASSD